MRERFRRWAFRWVGVAEREGRRILAVVGQRTEWRYSWSRRQCDSRRGIRDRQGSGGRRQFSRTRPSRNKEAMRFAFLTATFNNHMATMIGLSILALFLRRVCQLTSCQSRDVSSSCPSFVQSEILEDWKAGLPRSVHLPAAQTVTVHHSNTPRRSQSLYKKTKTGCRSFSSI